MSESANQTLEAVSVGLFIAPAGTEAVEFDEPRRVVTEFGASVDVIGIETGEAQSVDNDLEESETYEVDREFSEVSPDDYDALIVPGGTVGADRLRLDDGAVDLVREHVTAGKPIGAICHGPWLLVEADVVEGRTLTSFPSLRTDVRNAGGEWVDEEAVIDGNLVTSRKPDDLSAFCESIVETFAEGTR